MNDVEIHKSERLKKVALENNWNAEVVPNFDQFDTSGDYNDITWTLYALRGQETIKAVWYGNRLDSGLYTYGDTRRKLWWKTEILKYLNGEEKGGEVTWNDDTPAIDIMRAVINRKVTWIRKIDGSELDARVDVNLKEPASAKGFRVYTAKTGRRILEWVDSIGFHSVALDSIISVE
jgi:hypothetical protein